MNLNHQSLTTTTMLSQGANHDTRDGKHEVSLNQQSITKEGNQ